MVVPREEEVKQEEEERTTRKGLGRKDRLLDKKAFLSTFSSS